MVEPVFGSTIEERQKAMKRAWCRPHRKRPREKTISQNGNLYASPFPELPAVFTSTLSTIDNLTKHSENENNETYASCTVSSADIGAWQLRKMLRLHQEMWHLHQWHLNTCGLPRRYRAPRFFGRSVESLLRKSRLHMHLQ